MSGQFRPVGGVGARKVGERDQQFRPRYDNVFKRPPGPTAEEKHAEERKGRCVANDDTCKAYRAKGTEFCAGHLRSQGVTDEAE